MKKFLLFVFTLFPLAVSAQSVDSANVVPAVQKSSTYLFGYFSYKEAFEALPEYPLVQKQMAELKAKYEEEAKRAETEFNQKYEDFLAGQRDFPQSILEKRQSELQDLMAKNITFRNESRRLLLAAENDAYAPLHDKLGKLLNAIGAREGFAFILNTDDNACPFVNPSQGKDINQMIKDSLK